MRYFLTGFCSCETPSEHEVSKWDYVNAEVAKDIRSRHAIEGEPWNVSFVVGIFSGRQMVDTPEEALRLLVGCLTAGHSGSKDWKAALVVLSTGGWASGEQVEAKIEAEETRYWNT